MKVVTLITSSNRNGFTKQIVDSLTSGIEDAEGCVVPHAVDFLHVENFFKFKFLGV